VYVAGLLRREPRIAPWSMATTPSRPDTEPWISELLPDPATPVTTTSTPSGISTSTSRRLCALAPRISRMPVGVRTFSLRTAAVVEMAPVRVPLARSASKCPRSRPSRRPPGAGAEVDDVVGDRDRQRLVLHDEHRVALVPQA